MNHTMRVNVEERIVEAMSQRGHEYLRLREVTDLANADADFILGQGAVQACLERMAKNGSVMIMRGDPVKMVPTLFAFICHGDCAERTYCDKAGQSGHTSCGRCKTCNRPTHHCTQPAHHTA